MNRLPRQYEIFNSPRQFRLPSVTDPHRQTVTTASLRLLSSQKHFSLSLYRDATDAAANERAGAKGLESVDSVRRETLSGAAEQLHFSDFDNSLLHKGWKREQFCKYSSQRFAGRAARGPF